MSPRFKGGVHPPEKKEITKDVPITEIGIPDRVYIPLLQHTGAPAKRVVEVGDRVKTGQIIGMAEGGISANVHSSVSGKVVEVKQIVTPTGVKSEAVVIEAADEDTWELMPPINWRGASSSRLVARIKDAGIVGMGGAAFPTHVKLSPPKPVDVLIVNGAECEPYLTIDYRLMLERPQHLVEGVLILKKILGVEKCFIGIEDNKMEAVRAVQRFCDDGVEVKILPTKYPQGSEKQLIKAITGREVPSGGLPFDVGVVVQNVGTVIAVWEAVVQGKPLVERPLTVAGRISKPGNYKVRIGTTFEWVIDKAGGFSEPPARVINGGPMMGIAQKTLDVPVVKGTSGILVLGMKDVYNASVENVCIRCSKCVAVCPMGLRPTVIATLASKRLFEEAQKEGIFDCMECGACAYVCPSQIALVHLIKYGKNVIKALQKMKR